MKRIGFGNGKIILSGEYAVVFGKPGIAVPTTSGVTASFTEDPAAPLTYVWPDIADQPEWQTYLQQILTHCQEYVGTLHGQLAIQNELPLGKGMGSSTALVIAIARCLLGEENREHALAIEDAVNPGHSGIDFACIWENQPIMYTKDTLPEALEIDVNLLVNAVLIDTGAPNEVTAELVEWIQSREEDLFDTFVDLRMCLSLIHI